MGKNALFLIITKNEGSNQTDYGVSAHDSTGLR